MDKKGQAPNAGNFIDFQASTKYFFDTAQQCFEHCVTDFTSKSMSAAEKECTKACFSKQMTIYGSLVANISKAAGDV
jgi:Tim10/DDP family zinc finger